MSHDPVSVTTQKSWFQRLGAALGGVVFGFVLLLGGVILLGWNEGRSVQAARSVTEGARSIIAVDAGRVDPAHHGRLVHLTGPLTAPGLRTDARTRVSANALVLERKVEHYQWRETSRSESRKRLGGGEETVTTYSYDQAWTDRPVDSSGFHQAEGRANPPAQLESERFVAEAGAVGAHAADRGIIAQMTASTPLALDEADVRRTAVAVRRHVTAHEGGLYVGADPAQPAVGDMRIRYLTAPPAVVSVIAQQSGEGLRPHAARSGGTLFMVRQGHVSADAMFDQARASNGALTWGLRLAGIAALIAGVAAVLAPLGVLADVIPPLGALLRLGAGVVSFVVGGAIGAVTIALAWLAFRPLISLAILTVAGAGAAWLIIRMRRRRQDAVRPMRGTIGL